jgi:hypothetical protein
LMSIVRAFTSKEKSKVKMLEAIKRVSRNGRV